MSEFVDPLRLRNDRTKLLHQPIGNRVEAINCPPRQLRSRLMVARFGESIGLQTNSLTMQSQSCRIMWLAAVFVGSVAIASPVQPVLLDEDITVAVPTSTAATVETASQQVLSVIFDKSLTLSQSHLELVGKAVSDAILDIIEQTDGASLAEAIEDVMIKRDVATIYFADGAISNVTLEAVALGLRAQPISLQLTRQVHLTSKGAVTSSVTNATIASVLSRSKIVAKEMRHRRQISQTTTTGPPILNGGILSISFPRSGTLSQVDLAAVVAEVQQRSGTQNVALSGVAPAPLVATATFPPEITTVHLRHLAAAMDPARNPVILTVPSGFTLEGTVLSVTLQDGSQLTLTTAPTAPLPLTQAPSSAPVPTCPGIGEDDVICASLVTQLGCIAVLPRICPATCHACPSSAISSTGAPTVHPTKSPTVAPSLAPTVATPAPIPETCFGVIDPPFCASAVCSDASTAYSCPVRCDTCFSCNGIPDSSVCRLSFADCSVPSMENICPGKCAPRALCSSTNPQSSSTASTVPVPTPTHDACSIVDPNSAVAESNNNYCDCHAGFVDQAKPTNTRIHIKSIGNFNAQRGCTHLCAPAVPSTALCFCASNLGSAGCTVDNTATVLATIARTPANSGGAVTDTFTAASTESSATTRDACSVLDPNSRQSTSNSNFCDCVSGFVDGAKPTNSRIHIKSVGKFNPSRGCTHQCESARILTDTCFCTLNPTGRGCI